MSGLRELQAAVGRAVLGQDEPALGELIESDGIAPAARLRIYRHHYESSLAEALKAIYPVVCRLVDERFFAYAAHEYVKSSPPRRVCLHEYGADFAEFLAGFPPCRELVYLPDVARLEQAINVSLHSPVGEAVRPEAFFGLDVRDYPRLVFQLLPSLGYLESLWPIDRIWLGQQEGREGTVDLSEGGCRLEIRQHGEEVVFCRLDEAQFILRRALLAGETLEGAADAVLATDPMFDLAIALRRLLAEGLVAGFSLAPDSDNPN